MINKTIFHVCGGKKRNYGDLALVKSQRDLIEAEYGDTIKWETIEIKDSIPIDKELINKINKTGDMLLIGGGGLIMPGDGFETRSGWQLNIDTDDLLTVEVPIVVHALGYNVFPGNIEPLTDKAVESLSALHEYAALFSVRNTGSKKRLVDLGLEEYLIEICPDPGLFCERSDYLHPYAENKIDWDNLVIGLNIAGDRQNSRFGREQLISMIKNINKAVNNLSLDATIVHIPHVSIYDIEFTDLLKEHLTANFIDLSELLPWLYPESIPCIPEIVSIYRHVDAVIGMRGHSCMIPFGQGTPCIGLGNHNKVKYFIEDIKSKPILNDCIGLENMLNYELFDSGRAIERLEIWENFNNTSDYFVKRLVDLL